MLDAFLEFSQGLRVPGSGVVIAEVLFLVPRGAPAEAVRRSGLTSLFGFFRPRGEPKNQDRVLAESIGTELARLEAGIAEENGTLADYSGLRAAVCEFIPITASHAQTWVGDVDVRAWCGAQTEADMWKELRHCVSAYGTRMSRLVDPMYGLFMKYRKAGG
jgi:hypothetical protein